MLSKLNQHCEVEPMNPTHRSYSWYPTYAHSWPGKSVNRGTCKHSKVRRDRFTARHTKD